MIANTDLQVYHQSIVNMQVQVLYHMGFFPFSINLQITMVYHVWTENCVAALEKLAVFSFGTYIL